MPLTEVQDVLINEGLRRWDVRYYLAVLYSPRQGEQRLAVAYEVEWSFYTHIYSTLAHCLTRIFYPGFLF